MIQEMVDWSDRADLNFRGLFEDGNWTAKSGKTSNPAFLYILLSPQKKIMSFTYSQVFDGPDEIESLTWFIYFPLQMQHQLGYHQAL